MPKQSKENQYKIVEDIFNYFLTEDCGFEETNDLIFKDQETQEMCCHFPADFKEELGINMDLLFVYNIDMKSLKVYCAVGHVEDFDSVSFEINEFNLRESFGFKCFYETDSQSLIISKEDQSISIKELEDSLHFIIGALLHFSTASLIGDIILKLDNPNEDTLSVA